MMIDSSAYVHPSAKLEPNVVIGRNAFIDADVELGEGTVVRPFAMVTGGARLGKFNQVFPYACIGEAPQDFSYKGESTRVEAGDYNVFRENVTVHRGTAKGDGITRIGHRNYFMASSHIGHDCRIGDDNILVNYIGLPGFVELDHHINISAYSGIHQNVRIGAYSMISQGAMVAQDVPPFLMVVGGDITSAIGLNLRGLQRNGFSENDTLWLKRLYRIYYRSGLNQEAAISKIKSDILPHCAHAQLFLDFLTQSQRGILRK